MDMTPRINNLILGNKERPSVPDPSVSAGYARGLIDLAVSKGVDRAALLDRAGIDPVLLDDANSRVPFEAYVRLMRAAKTLSGDEALALHYGEAANLSQFSIVGLIGHAAPTMREAFEPFNRFVRLVVDADIGDAAGRFSLVRLGGGLWIVDNRRHPNTFPELTESAFAQTVCATRRFGDTPFVLEVHVSHADPGYRTEYERVLGAPVRFAAKRNAMRIDPAWQDAKVAALPRYMDAVLNTHAEALLKELESSQTVRGRAETAITPMLSAGGASVDAVSAKLGVSRQTLYRQLKVEGVTFEQVLDALRHKLALRYIGDDKISVNETTYLLGFSDPAAFSRAFKRWTGLSPRAMRAART